LEHLLFVAWLVFFAWLVTKTKFFLASGLSKPQLVILFLLKVIAGIFYGWVGLYYGRHAQMEDTWVFHYQGLIEYGLLYEKPAEYFTNLFHNPYETGFGNFFGSENSYWNDLKGNVFIKFISLHHVLSFGHYYVNVIFYSFVSLFGPVAFYRVMIDLYPGKKLNVLLAVFMIPSFFYWSSGIHKEGLIFLGIALIIYHIYFANKEGRYSVKRVTGLLLGLVLLALLRNFLLIILIPAILAWLVANRWPRHRVLCFSVVYFAFIILFFTLRYVDSRLDFPMAVANKQRAFREMTGGNSSIPIQEINPDVLSFARSVPQAVTLSFLRPYPSDIRHLLTLAAALEVGVLLLLFLFFLFFKDPAIRLKDNLVYFCLFFGISMLLSIGFSVNNLGAIVRYRSVVLPLLITLLVVRTDWKRINSVFSKNIRLKNNVPGKI
jgi:hypothetical protein